MNYHQLEIAPLLVLASSVNVFALLDGDDPGDKCLADLDPQHKDHPNKKKLVLTAACDYKLKLMKQPSPPAPVDRSKAPKKNPTPVVVVAGLRSTANAGVGGSSCGAEDFSIAAAKAGRH